MPAWITQLTVQQDYAWFCAALAWLGAAALLAQWGHRAAELPGGRVWLSLLVGGGLGTALAHLVMHAWPPESFNAERAGWDRWLSLMALLQTAAPLLVLARSCRRPVLWLVAALFSGVWLLRGDNPYLANSALAFGGLLLGFAAGWHLRQVNAGRLTLTWPLRTVLLASATQFAGTTGILAELVHQQSRWSELSHLGLPAALLQGVLATSVIALLEPLGAAAAPGEHTRGLAREARNHLLGLAAWLVAGLAMAWFTSRSARLAFEDSLVARARAAAVIIDRDHTRRIFGPRFKLQDFYYREQDSGRRNSLARVPWLLEVHRPAGDELARIEEANPGIHWAHLVSVRDDYLVSSVFSSRLRLKREAVSLLRRIGPEDWAHWYRREAFFEGPIIGNWGELVRAYAPIVHPEAGMLAWIALDFGVTEWTAAQALARLQSFALTAVAGGLLWMLFLRRLKELESLRLKEEAEIAQATDRAKTAFLAKVSHELRAPVQSILGFGELLAGLNLPDAPNRWLGAIRNQGQLLIRLVNDLLDLSAMQAGAFRLVPKPGDLAQLGRSCTDSLRTRAEQHGLDLRFSADPQLPRELLLDADRVRQILFNLVGNAIKFTPQGAIEVWIGFAPSHAVPDNVNAVPVVLRISDSGPGIATEDVARLFRPFSRLRQDEAREGAGLGLALTAALCASMAGSLTHSPNPAGGSIFTATLVLAGCDRSPEMALAATPVGSLAGRRVLVADDNSLVRELYLTILTTAGAKCESATDGLEAVEFCAREYFDAVVLDVSMPWLDGMEATRRIRALGRPGLRIVGASAHAGQTERELGLAAGMDAFLVKPVSSADLISALCGAGMETPPPRVKEGATALQRRLMRQFCLEIPRLAAEFKTAAEAGDRRWLANRGHYLKNSADVTGETEVSRTCVELMRLAGENQPGTRTELDALARSIVDQLTAILLRARPLSPESPDD